jgi:hypothetical protein
MKDLRKLLIGLFILGILSPLGLLVSGETWGEWSAEAISRMIGFIPEGLKRFSNIWRAPFADYRVGGTGEMIGYLVSAFGGMLLVMLATWIIGKILAHRHRKNSDDQIS